MSLELIHPDQMFDRRYGDPQLVNKWNALAEVCWRFLSIEEQIHELMAREWPWPSRAQQKVPLSVTTATPMPGFSNRYFYRAKIAVWNEGNARYEPSGTQEVGYTLVNNYEANNTATKVLDGITVGNVGNATIAMLPIQTLAIVEASPITASVWTFSRDNVITVTCTG